MNEIIATLLLRSNIAIPHFACFSNLTRFEDVEALSIEGHTGTPRRSSGSHADYRRKATNLRIESNYTDTVAQTMSTRNRSL